MQPIVSIITPCFNAEKYLRETLDCLQKQTINKWECIIVNDGSTDQSSAIAHEYAAKDSRYIIIDKKNEGPSAARNVGIKASHGKYILPLDADDLIEPSYLELAVDYLENCDDCKAVYCEGDYFGDKHGNLEWAIFKGYKSLLLQNSTFNAIVFKKKDALLIGVYDEKMKGYELKPYRGVIAIKVDGEWKKMNASKIVIKPEPNGFVSVKRKWYRGHFKVINDGLGLTVINDIPLEKYLQGVVPSEMPSSWEHEAHKAQAIAARSYAVANLGKHASQGYDLKDMTTDKIHSFLVANRLTIEDLKKYYTVHVVREK